jgi:hypothetical protein
MTIVEPEAFMKKLKKEPTFLVSAAFIRKARRCPICAGPMYWKKVFGAFNNEWVMECPVHGEIEVY